MAAPRRFERPAYRLGISLLILGLATQQIAPLSCQLLGKLGEETPSAAINNSPVRVLYVVFYFMQTNEIREAWIVLVGSYFRNLGSLYAKTCHQA
jgi:hypothetical protein